MTSSPPTERGAAECAVGGIAANDRDHPSSPVSPRTETSSGPEGPRCDGDEHAPQGRASVRKQPRTERGGAGRTGGLQGHLLFRQGSDPRLRDGQRTRTLEFPEKLLRRLRASGRPQGGWDRGDVEAKIGARPCRSGTQRLPVPQHRAAPAFFHDRPSCTAHNGDDGRGMEGDAGGPMRISSAPLPAPIRIDLRP